MSRPCLPTPDSREPRVAGHADGDVRCVGKPRGRDLVYPTLLGDDPVRWASLRPRVEMVPGVPCGARDEELLLDVALPELGDREAGRDRRIAPLVGWSVEG